MKNNSPHTRKKEWGKSQRASMLDGNGRRGGSWERIKSGGWDTTGQQVPHSLLPWGTWKWKNWALELLTSSFLAPQVHLICLQTPCLLGNNMQFFLSCLWKKTCNLCLCLGESSKSANQVLSTHETVGAFTWSQCCLLKQKLKIFN